MGSFVFNAEKTPVPPISGMQNVTIKGAKYALSSAGNHMINIRYELEDVVDAADRSVTVFGRLIFVPAGWYHDLCVDFINAIGRNPIEELGGKDIDEAMLTEWAESLLGEALTIRIVMKPDNRPIEGTQSRPDQPDITGYYPYGSAKSVKSLLGDL